jgi:hypothetical protein
LAKQQEVIQEPVRALRLPIKKAGTEVQPDTKHLAADDGSSDSGASKEGHKANDPGWGRRVNKETKSHRRRQGSLSLFIVP